MKKIIPHKIEWNEEKINAFWDFYSKSLKNKREYYSKQYGEGLISLCKNFVTLGNKIFDYGCGDGSLLDLLIKEKKYCFGEDQSIEGMKELSKRLDGNKYHKNMDKVDSVFMVETLEHLMDSQIKETLDHLKEKLNEKGNIIITVPNNENLDKHKYNHFCPDCGSTFHYMQHINSYDRRRLSALMYIYGFEEIKCIETDMNLHKKELKWKLRKIYSYFRKDQFKPHLIYIGKKK